MLVEFSDRAVARLQEIEDYIAERGHPHTAVAFVGALVQQASALGPVAESLRAFYVSPATGYAYRSFPHRGYRIVYVALDERVIVVDLFHGSRSPDGLMASLSAYEP